MVDRHFKTYAMNSNPVPYRSTGGTRLPPYPRKGPRNYFAEDGPEETTHNHMGNGSNGAMYHDSADMVFEPTKYNQNGQSNNGATYHDSVDWSRPRMNASYGHAVNAAIGSFYTGDLDVTNVPDYNTRPRVRNYYYGNEVEPRIRNYNYANEVEPNAQPNIRYYNYGNEREPITQPYVRHDYVEEERPVPKTSPFACEPLSNNANSSMESTVTDLGNANSYFDQVTFKIFNDKVIPGHILYGVIYFEVSQEVKINKIVLNGICNVHTEIGGKDTEKQVDSFEREIVANKTGRKRRQPNEYHALTENWDGDDLIQTLELPVDYFPEDNLEWPFAGPITLPKGTHAIPFAVRIPPEVNPTLTYSKNGERRKQKATVNHKTNVSVEINAQPATGGAPMTVLSDMLALNIQSCGGLPPVVNGAYAPGSAHLVDLDYKSSKALIILEKKHFSPGDTIRIFICTDIRNAVERAYAELVASYNLPEIGCSDSDDVTNPMETPGIESLSKCKKKSLYARNNNVFISKVSDKYPTSGANSTPAFRLSSNNDDKRLMPESSRKESVWLELNVPTNADCSIEAGDYRIRYHVRVHLYVHGKRKPISKALIITIADHLMHNYTVKYIKFVN